MTAKRVICEVTGEIVASDSEEWRHDCECRYLATLIDEDRQKARDYFAGVKKKRGEQAWATLFDDVSLLRQFRRETKRGATK